MCVTCGCSEGAEITLNHLGKEQNSAEHRHLLADGRVITHTHAEPHAQNDHIKSDNAHIHSQTHQTILTLEQNLLAKNDQLAAQNRAWFQKQQILGLNLVSSPGSGKTTLLTRTIRDLQTQIPISVIEGDQATSNDAQRIRETGCGVVQINTGTGCHLEAAMIQRGLEQLAPPTRSIVMIENVGNLVCPALFDLGEQAKVVILSVTEGEDKPIKYPHMFRASQIMILNKIDLLPYVEFDCDRCLDYAISVNPHLEIFQVSATTGEGLDAWYRWLRNAI
jgi:hydrogenase nickel incorporation protein HypB